MTSILFVRKPHVYLPEIKAYRHYLARHHPNVECFESTDMTDYNVDEYDIIWHFMGLDITGKGCFVVHEYNSLSTPPCAKLKNLVKKTINRRPDRRIFLMEKVKKDFGFDDNVPDSIRDMGIDSLFFDIERQSKPEFDFICVGGLNRGPVITALLERFQGPLKDASILLVGDAPDALQERYERMENIVFQGRVPYQKVPTLMSNAHYGLNIMPDIYPFNVQTSTKVLEYCAAGLPVVTTDYEWINSFEGQSRGAFFKLAPDMGNLDMKTLASFDFIVPDVSALKWEPIIAESGIFSFLK